MVTERVYLATVFLVDEPRVVCTGGKGYVDAIHTNTGKFPVEVGHHVLVRCGLQGNMVDLPGPGPVVVRDYQV